MRFQLNIAFRLSRELTKNEISLAFTDKPLYWFYNDRDCDGPCITAEDCNDHIDGLDEEIYSSLADVLHKIVLFSPVCKISGFEYILDDDSDITAIIYICDSKLNVYNVTDDLQINMFIYGESNYHKIFKFPVSLTFFLHTYENIPIKMKSLETLHINESMNIDKYKKNKSVGIKLIKTYTDIIIDFI
jgi:hypothetical protein